MFEQAQLALIFTFVLARRSTLSIYAFIAPVNEDRQICFTVFFHLKATNCVTFYVYSEGVNSNLAILIFKIPHNNICRSCSMVALLLLFVVMLTVLILPYTNTANRQINANQTQIFKILCEITVNF